MGRQPFQEPRSLCRNRLTARNARSRHFHGRNADHLVCHWPVGRCAVPDFKLLRTLKSSGCLLQSVAIARLKEPTTLDEN